MLSELESFRHRFEIKKELGRGATGEVHLAFDTFSQREVAIKLTWLKLFEDPENGPRFRRMWLNETRLAGMLKHPFIVEVYEAGSAGEYGYLVMEYLSGGTLKQHTAMDRLLPFDRVIDVIYKVCNALDYANRQGLLHRDIKPANVMLGEGGAVKVADFGTAYFTESEVTQVFDVGTLPFMPPEHFRKAPPTIQADIYAVGVMAYQLLTGKLPFSADSYENLIYQKLHEDAIPLERRRNDVPPALRFAVHRAMHKDIEVRYASWKAFCDNLAVALPHVARPEEARFDSERFNTLRNLAFFSGFGDTEIWETVRISRWEERRDGEAIVAEGAPGGSLFVIASGEAVVTKSGVQLNRMGPGDCFGEIAYLDEERRARSATVTAFTPMALIEIEGESLRKASAGLQTRFARAFMGLMVERLRNADRRLLAVLGMQ